MKAILRQVRISPKKVNLIAAMVRNKKVTDALDLLHFVPKKAAPILKKVISSAMANAENNFKQEREALYIKEIVVTEGTTLKRGVPISKGRVHPIKKKTTHITVKLVQLSEAPKKSKRAKAASKKADTAKVATEKKSAPKKAEKKEAVETPEVAETK